MAECDLRLKRLLVRLKTNSVEKERERGIFEELAAKVYSRNEGLPEVLRKSEFLTAFSEEYPAVCDEGELLVGSMKFWTTRVWDNRAFHGNLGHVIVDYGRVLRRGITGLRDDIERMPCLDDRQRVNREAFRQTLAAFSSYIAKHAAEAERLAAEKEEPVERADLLAVGDCCRRIAKQPPETFREALQLLWFSHVFLHAEGMGAAVSFGRFGQILYPYYVRDLERGDLTRETAKELLRCFWLKTCEGDESQNLTLGGETENELSLLCLEVTGELKVWQPSVSVRIGRGTSEAFWAAAIRLIRAGMGMPAIFNDRIVERALVHAGIAPEDVGNYGIVGCYEANPQGQALGLTVAGSLRLYQVLLGFLYSAEQRFDTFEELKEGFKDFFIREYRERYLPGYAARWERIQKETPSPFESLCLTGCLESGLAAEEGGAKYTMFGVNVLGLGTVADSLYVLKKLVFEEKKFTLEELLRHVRENFPDEELLRECRGMPGKYGTDEAETNRLAEELSAYVARTVMDNRICESVITYPGLFLFTADIRSGEIPATPDGRRRGERVSYGVGPSDFCGGITPTTVLNSASHASGDLCACGNPLMLSFSRRDAEAEGNDAVLRSLIESYFDRGGFHLQCNVVAAETLEEAKRSPETYPGLLIRISGYSARFVTLDGELQDALIQRTKRGS